MNSKKAHLFCIAETFSISFIGGCIFYIIHTPIPWTLGPLIATVLWQRLTHRPVCWPTQIRNVGLVLVGYGMGSTFTEESGWLIVSQLPSMVIITTLISLTNSIMGTIPGGVQQMAIFCDDIPEADITVVTYADDTSNGYCFCHTFFSNTWIVGYIGYSR